MNQAYSVWFREKGISLPGHWKQARSWSVATLIAILAATMLSCSSGTDETPNVTQSVPGIGSGGGGSGTNLPPVGNVSDPLFAEQWHLQNTGQGGGIPGEDSRVVGAWNLGRSGLGVRVAVVDDGLEIGHEDLAPNIVLGQSFNYLTNGSDPTPANSGPCSGAGGTADCHGTSVAGVIGAFGNQTGGRGAAPYAALVGYNLLAAGVFSPDSVEADAMSRNAAAVWVSNNSWGAPDDGILHASGPLWKAAVLNGLAQGRSGKGTVYVWAGGNGGARRNDNSNYEGYSNFRGVIAICAVDANGSQTPYSDPGANLWGCTPSSAGTASLPAIVTTDRSAGEGYNRGTSSFDVQDPNYTNTFGGTSSATALASGIITLVLEANPNLGWRDVRIVLAETARQNDPGDVDWTVNGGGYAVNHKYGFGVLNAEAAVIRAATWTPLGPQKSYSISVLSNQSIADLATVASPANVAGSGISRIEWVEIELTADHQNDGDLEVILRHEGTGTSSVLAQPRVCPGTGIELCGDYAGWVFGSARHLGEAADGSWTLTVRDGLPGSTGTLNNWKLTFYGT
ncbi:serine protease [Nitrospira sp.]|nr:serine protease [Nitrospira sp.]